jgi:hypothetical protein
MNVPIVIYALQAGVQVIAADPPSYREAMKSIFKDEWRRATMIEMEALRALGAWILVVRPEGAHVVGSRWVFKTKRNERGEVVKFKARFVAQGFSQVPGQDFTDTFAPVTRFTSVRIVLALAQKFGWMLHNMDVDNAFLNAPVNEDIYVRQAEGFEEWGPNGEELVYKLNKSLYGCRQAPHNWNADIDAWLRKYGVEPTKADPCLYVMRRGNGVLVVLLWVDDLIITGTAELVKAFKAAISAHYKMKDLGQLKWILGMQVIQDEAAGTLEIVQTAYIDQLLERYGMANCSPVSTPMEGQLKRLERDDPAVLPEPDRKRYMSIVGAVLYLAMVTRPDVAYAVQALGRHMQACGPEHMVAAKRLLRYLKGTRTLGIKYGADQAQRHEAHLQDLGIDLELGEKVVLFGYSDSDWANDPDKRRSTTGYTFVLEGGSVSWMSKLQPTVARSSTDAEYMAACAATQEAVYLRRLLEGLGYKQEGATLILEDNQGCIALSENPVNHQRTKHIDVQYHFVRERVESGEVRLVYVPTEHQLADILTKPLPKARVEELRKGMLGHW